MTTQQFSRIMCRGVAVIVAMAMVAQLSIEAEPVVNLFQGWLIDAIMMTLLVVAAFFGGYALLDMARGSDYRIPAVVFAGAVGLMLVITVFLMIVQAVVGAFVSPDVLLMAIVFVSVFVLLGEFFARVLPTETETTEE